MPLSSVLHEVSERVAAAEGLDVEVRVPDVHVPDTVPENLAGELAGAA